MDKKIIGMMGLTGFLIIGIILLSGCIEEKPKENLTQEQILVAVSILPQIEFVEKVGGDKVKVMVMVPPGASPHTYEPTPNQMIDLSNAKIYAKVGSGVEFELGWMDKIADLNKNMLVVDCSDGIKLMDIAEEEKKAHKKAHEAEEAGEENKKHEEHEESSKDPHIWLSPKNAKIMAENIYKGLIKVDPANKEYYWKNMEIYIAELDEIDRKISEKLKNLSNRKILVFHPAWGYFCKDYNLTQVAIEKSGKEPTPEGIRNLITQAKENNISIIFASPEFSTRSAEAIANEINGKVVLISPLERNYTANLYKVADMFSKI